jgi:Cdc6-like AAA superfamily ATPase
MSKPIINYEALALKLGQVFTPSATVRKEELFRGRKTEVRAVVDAINQIGQHVVLYGEAGVGKTSLGEILKTRIRATDAVPIIAPLVNCDSSDDYSTIWLKVFEQISDEYPDANAFADTTTEFLDGDDGGDDHVEAALLSPRDVRRKLEPLAQHGIAYVILDEFDKIGDLDTRKLMADTVKLFSDRAVEVTIILIGVSDSVNGLIEDHRSIERCLAQVHMPRMAYSELIDIVNTGLKTMGMTIETDALDEIAGLSKGLPHYTHLLALHAGRCALDNKRLVIAKSHVNQAIKTAITQTQESIRHHYDEATYSTKKNTLHRQVLLACALADSDEFGYFQPVEACTPLSVLLNEGVTQDRFASHLKTFCDRKVLYRTGGEYRWRYRFSNPLMQPYVIMKGLDSGLIQQDQLNFAAGRFPLFITRRSMAP